MTSKQCVKVAQLRKKCSLEESGLIHDIHELKGKTLGCWCASSDCHANILAEIVDGEFLKNLVDLLD